MGKISKKERLKRKHLKRSQKFARWLAKNEKGIRQKEKSKPLRCLGYNLRMFNSGIFYDLYGKKEQYLTFIYSYNNKCRFRKIYE